MGWKAKELVDYAAVLRCDSLFITDLGPFESFTDRYLKGVKQYADDKGIKLYIGSWSICPTSPSFKKDWGTAAEHLALGVRVSKVMGSPAFRVILGSRKDRLTEGGIDARIDDTVKLLKANKSRATDAGIKIAEDDVISDDGEEVYSFLRASGIANLLVMGVHTNMCVLNRSFAIKQMTAWGIRCVLVRDLTDTMYNPGRAPYVSHDRGTELVVEYIERHWCPSMLSRDLLESPT